MSETLSKMQIETEIRMLEKLLEKADEGTLWRQRIEIELGKWRDKLAALGREAEG